MFRKMSHVDCFNILKTRKFEFEDHEDDVNVDDVEPMGDEGE